MSEICIVCLGDLGENASAHHSHPSPRPVKSPSDGALALGRSSSIEADCGLIAHLLPCGHDLHNDCLKPWVERANSCPICRQSFNQVELSTHIGDPSISSYAVTDRTQVADLDPSMIVDEELYQEPEERPCPVCRNDDHEEFLVACDACDAYYHTLCVGLETVPLGPWFCENCEAQRLIESVDPVDAERPPRPPQSLSDRRTRAQQRRVWDRNQASSSNWARVWQSVWDHLNLDLDFPFDEDPEVATSFNPNRVNQRREFLEWERRLRVAERQGAGDRFRDTASTLLHPQTRRAASHQPEPESQEEIRAWNAFEKAREIEADPSPKRKRRSATTSPSELEPSGQQERALKRPRTRRAVGNDASSPHPDARRSSLAGPSSSRAASSTTTATPIGGPSLLQSMLRRIEESNTPDEQALATPARLTINSVGGNNPTRPSSPRGSSPASSNHASPRARSITPPPSVSPRPSSPLGLTSKIEPIFSFAQFSPERSPAEPSIPLFPSTDRPSRSLQQTSSPPRSQEASPTRASVPFSTKTDLQKMVSSALKPHYQSNMVSKDQYTDINRNVSRLLYDRAGEQGYVGNTEKENYERLAADEVSKAVDGLKATT